MDPNSIGDKKKAAYYMRNNPGSSGSSGGSSNGFVSMCKVLVICFVIWVVAQVLLGK